VGTRYFYSFLLKCHKLLNFSWLYCAGEDLLEE
jgi:hypothetical protein